MKTKRRTKINARQLALDAMLAAMCAVLGYVAVDALSIKITFESLPILLGGLLFGPLDGALIGLVGTGVYQLLRYGVSATTVLWMLPYIISGLVAGFYAKRRNFELDRKQALLIAIVCELLVTLLNTPVMYLDSKIYGYYFKGYISGMLLVRLGVALAKGIVFGLVLPPLEAEPADDAHPLRVERVEDMYYVTIPHEMSKTHYISFLAAVRDDGCELR